MARSHHQSVVLRQLFSLGEQLLKGLGYHLEVRHFKHDLGLWIKKIQRVRPAGQKRRRLVIVPGFGDSPLSWTTTLTLLQPRLKRLFDEIILFDFPGFNGFLGHLPCFESTQTLGETTLSALNALKPHTIIGHSLGGWVSAWYASHKDPTLKQLILMAPASLDQTDEGEENLASIFEATLRLGSPAIRPRLFAKEPLWFKALAHHYEAFLSRKDIRSFITRSLEISQDDPSPWTISSLTQVSPQIRVSLLWGAEDELIHLRAMRRWLRYFKKRVPHRLRVYTLDEVGHTPQVESPALLALLLQASFQLKTMLPPDGPWYQQVYPTA
jgi:pimeloyl-ACP methyl ester carboxylesterase